MINAQTIDIWPIEWPINCSASATSPATYTKSRCANSFDTRRDAHKRLNSNQIAVILPYYTIVGVIFVP